MGRSLAFSGDVAVPAKLRPVAVHSAAFRLDTMAQTIREAPDLRDNRVHDMHTTVLRREHGITRSCTLDNDFRRFPLLQVINPLL